MRSGADASGSGGSAAGDVAVAAAVASGSVPAGGRGRDDGGPRGSAGLSAAATLAVPWLPVFISWSSGPPKVSEYTRSKTLNAMISLIRKIAEIARKLREAAGLPKEPTGAVANGKAQTLTAKKGGILATGSRPREIPGMAMDGKVVISCVNPLAFDKRGAHGQVINGGEGSAAESAG